MNFYKHHIGDYDQATRHLSFIEDAAYCRMLRKYFAEEKCLPEDIKRIEKLIGARTRDERQAVASVLEEFFTLEEDGWHNKRADEELAKANAQAEVNRQTALKREANKRAKQGHEPSTNRDQGDSTNRDTKPHEPCSGDQHESCSSREPSQTPDSRLQTEGSSVGGRDTAPSGTRAGAICKRLRLLGIDAMPHQLQHPEWVAMLAIRTDDDIFAVAEIAKAKRPNDRLSLNYLLPMLRDQAPASLTGGTRHATSQGTVAATVADFTGRSGSDSRDGGGEEAFIEGSATRVVETG